MISSKLENLNRLPLERELLGLRKRKLLSPEVKEDDEKLWETTGGATEDISGTAVVFVMGTNPNSNLGFFQLFIVVALVVVCSPGV